jgi:hypothetical protein
LTIFVEKGGNPLKVCKIYKKEGRNSPRLLSSGHYGTLQTRVMQLIQLLLYAVILNYVNRIENIHSLIIPQGYYYTNAAKINGRNSDT